MTSDPTPRQIQNEMYIMRDLYLDSGVEYWLDLGVLLGIVRNGAPLEWDDDLEFGAWSKDANKIINLMDDLDEFDMYVKTYRGDVQGLTLLPLEPGRVKTTVVFYSKYDDFAWSATGERRSNWNLLSRLHSAYCWQFKNEMKLDPIVNTINDIRTRRVPKSYYENRKLVDEYSIHVPSPVEEYLEYVYGNWEDEKKDYDYWEDSGLITNQRPEQIVD